MKLPFRGMILLSLLLVYGFRLHAQELKRFAPEIKAFINSDKASPPSTGCILFVGSSSIRFWESLAKDFPDYCVMNRGFGGSEYSDANYYFNLIVAPYKPQIVVVYEGDNDLVDNKTPEMVYGDFEKFMEKTTTLPGNPPVLVIAAKPSPSRWKYKDDYLKLNSMEADYCKRHDNDFFIDIFNSMLGDNGRPEPDLYRQDSLHMLAKGYAIWKSKLDPYLEKYYDPGKVMLNNH